MSDRLRVALLYGGDSDEAAISERSARQVLFHLDPEQYEVYPIEIRPTVWFYTPFDASVSQDPISIDMRDLSFTVDGGKKEIDVCFIAAHGGPGEDGRVQGFLEVIGKPYTSTSTAISALTFNKRLASGVALASGLDVPKSVFVLEHENIGPQYCAARLQLPVFVKPCCGGSSLGVSLVSHWDDLSAAILLARMHGGDVLVDERIAGDEYTLAVFRHNQMITTTPPLLCHPDPTAGFSDFAAKYGHAGYTDDPTDAPSAELDEMLSTFAKSVFRAFGGKGLMRIDLVVSASNNRPYLLEVNTIPGMTQTSALPFLIKQLGLSLSEFYGAMIEEALHERRSEHNGGMDDLLTH